MKTTTFNLNPRKGQPLEDRIVELIIKFVKEKSQEKDEDKIRYLLEIEKLSFERGTPIIKLSRRYATWGWVTEVYTLSTAWGKGSLLFDGYDSSAVTASEEFQNELITYLEQESKDYEN